MWIRRATLSCVPLALAVVVPDLTAAGAPLLTSFYESQLEGWLGAGDLVFKKIYAKKPGQTVKDLHLAVDGKGPTFTLLEASVDGNTYVIGGYNPQPWLSHSGYALTSTDSSRTAFIFNLTLGTVQFQRLTSDTSDTLALGRFQTLNDAQSGPTFGAGPDLWVDTKQSAALTIGGALQGSFGTSVCPSFGQNILGAVHAAGSTCAFNQTTADFSVGSLEVYTFTPMTCRDSSASSGRRPRCGP
jgi:hypothetical protein